MENAYRLLVSPARGLLIYMPILCFSFLGALKLIQSNKTDIVILCTLICVGLLLVVSAFNGWHGGRSTGPRYLVVSLPFWCILLSGLCGSMGPVLKKVYVLLALISGLNMLVIVTVTTMIRRSVPQPLYTLYGWFFTGSFDHYDRPVRLFQDLTADQWAMTKFNWGQIVGLNGLPSIVPFLAIFGIGTWLLLREVKQSSKP